MSHSNSEIEMPRGNWTFSGINPDLFQAHIEKSIPGYREGYRIITSLSDYFIGENSCVVDLGCSNGQLIRSLSNFHQDKSGLRFIGIESAQTFQAPFSETTAGLSRHHTFDFSLSRAENMELPMSDLFISYYTFQFLKPMHRQPLINRIYSRLNWGGGFFLFEKVRGPDARFQDMFNTSYFEYKLANNFSAEEILDKHLSLKGVLEPYTSQANLDFLRRAGFSDVAIIYKNICFEGILAIK